MISNRLLCLMFIFASCFINLAAAADIDSYRLGPGDLVRIQVFGEPELTMEVRLGDNGLISYPFLGNLKVADKNTKEIEEVIYKGLAGDYLISPNVNVSVLEYRLFFIDGEVTRPGGYPYQPGLTVSKAIAIAQGLSERASTNKIWLVRGNASNARKRVSLDTEMQPGDIITVGQSFF